MRQKLKCFPYSEGTVFNLLYFCLLAENKNSGALTLVLLRRKFHMWLQQTFFSLEPCTAYECEEQTCFPP